MNFFFMFGDYFAIGLLYENLDRVEVTQHMVSYNWIIKFEIKVATYNPDMQCFLFGWEQV